MKPECFKTMRMRPENFPSMRLAQFASLVIKCPEWLSDLIEQFEVKSIKNWFQSEIPTYWKRHYRFSKRTALHRNELSDSAIERLIINGLLPVLFLYGRENNMHFLIQRAIEILESLKPEDNHLIRKWKNFGLTPKHAADTQAMLQLHQHHCADRKCFSCPIGLEMIRVAAHSEGKNFQKKTGNSVQQILDFM